MSRENVEQFITLFEDAERQAACGLDDAEPADVLAYAKDEGMEFSEADLRSALNTRICDARSLPRPWGWPLARHFGLVRK